MEQKQFDDRKTEDKDLYLRSWSIAQNAVNEMARSIGRGDQRLTDDDMDRMYTILHALNGMERAPQPSVGPVMRHGVEPVFAPRRFDQDTLAARGINIVGAVESEMNRRETE